jgi:hypothetical protein
LVDLGLESTGISPERSIPGAGQAFAVAPIGKNMPNGYSEVAFDISFA